ncbi:gramicidin S synthase 2 [Clostridium saccharobutylicum]|uniref:non-ribosomal peptide synthetase n=1 Tax=Clostridium saccharobutylicum TaxID=169679 RepID=UPI000983D680|nr:AMP-binding protein [Clostridium saccharobutylicum]AQS08924.1 gramicidin S synthase 2 [Clostridium saccharobutylicum]MBC2438127.1 AMP-binding protein [Clostridium saccharobutylicum]NSB90645.1 non-ribosomal peptide synthetase component F [Clostridium saccharobutylicum]NYC28728.1 non-ribosomal peptide synthetase component F [Clostridium saccharobutylicum]OOM18895.1 gramicidin S synthase 2 [Clostridium saccharobutylicum]
MDTQFFLQERLSIEEKNYWLQELSEPLPIINVPIDFPQHNKKYSKKLSKTIILDKNLKDGLTKFNSEFNVQAIMIAAYFAWIARLSNEKDILIEVNIDNTAYPIRISIENIKTFKDLLLLVKEKLNNASKYIFIPEEIVKDEIYKTLFQTTFSINSNKKPENESIIDWEIKEQENDMAINVHYDVDLFRTNTIERFIKYYMSILESVIKNQNTSIYSINILTEDEIKIYNELNNTYMELPNYNTIPKMFEEAVHNFPNNIAISSEEGQFTYKQLNERANQLANGLINKGLEKGDFVTIFMKRSLETIIAILGIIKAGGVYVPLDPEHPEERNTYIISDTKSPFIVTKTSYINKAKELLSNVLSVKEIILMENDISTFGTVDSFV